MAKTNKTRNNGEKIRPFSGKYYHQKDGGPIGMRIAGSVEKVVMAAWGSRMLGILKENEKI